VNCPQDVVILAGFERINILPNDREEEVVVNAAERQQLSDVAFEITVLEDFPGCRSKTGSGSV
jgi:hypothetical protein